jgi:hypothetical protein
MLEISVCQVKISLSPPFTSQRDFPYLAEVSITPHAILSEQHL